MDVRLPSLGEGADSGVVVSLLVNEGDTVEQGQTILELENEKAVAPIPSTAAGRVTKIHVKAGDRISVGARLLTIGESVGAAAPAPAPAAKPVAPAPVAATPQPMTAPVAVAAPEPVLSVEPPPASPGVRKIAQDLGIDLRRVRGSQPGGRVVMEDLRAYVQSLVATASAPKAAAPTATVVAASAAERIDFSQWGPVTKKPLTQLRKVIARRMSESWRAVPRVTQFDEADITALMELRKKYADAYKAKGANLTVTCFTLRAVVAALKKHPIFNSSLDEAAQEVVLKDYLHIGMAVDTEGGLIVPVIRDVDKKSLFDLAKELGTLAERTRERKVTADEMKGGTFTISNQGAIGGAHFTPIVNLPEVAILGLGKGALKPSVVSGKIEPRLLLPLTLSYDHRVIDGGTAARFTVDLVNALVNFPEAEVKLCARG
ncbi:MAG TPA: 2-oxo acid dehydrogenase subunit E2 [Verrucomicrobiae bacterium]|jgi:pyruvate dehydrogenase E2 component (dihydrolipoamide acetyltransferase)